jgi:hypothetical protein
MDFCDVFLGKSSEKEYEFYLKNEVFRDYIDKNHILYNSSEYSKYYKNKTNRLIPTLYNLYDTCYCIRDINLLSIYYHTTSLFIRGMNNKIYLKKKFSSIQEARIFTDSLSAPITPNVVRQFTIIKE